MAVEWFTIQTQENWGDQIEALSFSSRGWKHYVTTPGEQSLKHEDKFHQVVLWRLTLQGRSQQSKGKSLTLRQTVIKGEISSGRLLGLVRRRWKPMTDPREAPGPILGYWMGS